MDARGGAYFALDTGGRTWVAPQILDDPEGDHDWRIGTGFDPDARDEGRELGGRPRALRPPTQSVGACPPAGKTVSVSPGGPAIRCWRDWSRSLLSSSSIS